MACTSVYSINLSLMLALFSAPAMSLQIQQDELSAEETLVRVKIIVESRSNAVEINGRTIKDYSPTIIHDFSSIGIVINDKSNIMTFPGYNWIDMQGRNFRVEISAKDGRLLNGKLIGIDQNNGVAVLQLTEGKLNKTPVCTRLAIKDDITAPLPAIGQPILAPDHCVIGFVAGMDPADMRAIVYPIDQMLASAEKILKAGGDIRTGWLGIFLLDAPPANDPLTESAGIVIQRVEPNSPAQKAGLLAQDLLRKYNGNEIRSALQFIRLVESTPIGSKVAIEIVRQGKPINITAMIEARKPLPNRNQLSLNLANILDASADGTSLETGQPDFLIGMVNTELTPDLADALHMPGQKGLLVTKVVKQKPAEKAGVLVGDVIAAVNGHQIVDIDSFVSYWETHDLGAQMVLKVLRKGIERTITIQVPSTIENPKK
jgi:S1-C subfamily serine protease